MYWKTAVYSILIFFFLNGQYSFNSISLRVMLWWTPLCVHASILTYPVISFRHVSKNGIVRSNVVSHTFCSTAFQKGYANLSQPLRKWRSFGLLSVKLGTFTPLNLSLHHGSNRIIFLISMSLFDIRIPAHYWLSAFLLLLPACEWILHTFISGC